MMAVWILIASTAVVFLAFTIAFGARRAAAEEWTGIPLPGILWANTTILIASSAGLELARRSLRGGRRLWFTKAWLAGTVLGFTFLFGQAKAWLDLSSAGIYLASSTGSAFFYILTGAHAFHLLGGVLALSYVAVKAFRFQLGPAKRTAADASACFWHFLGVVWIGIIALFLVWN
jgi:cytochrome c oxidase subunit III